MPLGRPGKMFGDFFKNQKVFITGHTGFKGTWLCKILVDVGADVCGYSLDPPTMINLYDLIGIEKSIKSVKGDIRDFSLLKNTINKFNPDIVIHLAAQPLVIDGYKDPRYTYETNVMGTVNILESVRSLKSVKSLLNVTTDKVYFNREWDKGYKEDDQLNGFDPYSNSKSCSELVTFSYKKSFFDQSEIPVSTARAGNVIGGGDFAVNRIIPDCVRAVSNNEIISIRNPDSIRPYQHILEPLFGYLLIIKKQYESHSFADNYNIGPDDCDCITTEKLVNLFCEKWGDNSNYVINKIKQPHEATFLRLNSEKIKKKLGWKPKLHIDECMELTCDFYKSWLRKDDLANMMSNQITEYSGR